MKKILSIVLVLAMVMGLCVMASAAEESHTIDFSTFPVGVQYADETVTSGEFTVYSYGGHINSQLRLYDSSTNDSTAVIVAPGVIKSLSLNAGNKNATLKVYGSANGTDWTEIAALSVTSAYGDHTVTIPAGSSYTQIKLDAVGAQIRVKTITVGYEPVAGCDHVWSDPVIASEGHDKHSKTYTCSVEGCPVVTKVEKEDHNIEDGKCTVCDYKLPAKLNPHAVVTAPVAGTAYKLWLYQEHVEINDLLYINGEMDASKDYYFALTDDHTKAIDVYVEEATGGYYVYKLDGETKLYMNVYLNGNYVNAKWSDTPTLYTWDADYNTFVTAEAIKGEDKYFVGTYNNYTNGAPSASKYLAQGNYALHLSTPEDVSEYYTKPEVPENGDFTSVIVALLAVSAMGITVLAKKKEF